MKFDVNVPWVVPSQNIVFYWLILIRGQIRGHTVLHRITMGENSNIFFSETTGPISVKFDVNVPLVVPSQNIVFYWLISIRGLMRLCTVLHRITIGKISNTFFSKTTGPISMEFVVNVP